MGLYMYVCLQCVDRSTDGTSSDSHTCTYTHAGTHPVHRSKVRVRTDPVEAGGERGEVVEGVDVVAYRRCIDWCVVGVWWLVGWGGRECIYTHIYISRTQNLEVLVADFGVDLAADGGLNDLPHLCLRWECVCDLVGRLLFPCVPFEQGIGGDHTHYTHMYLLYNI